MEHGEDGGSEQPGSSDIGQYLALRKMIGNGTFEPMALDHLLRGMNPLIRKAVQEEVGPVVEDMHKLVEIFKKIEEKLLTGGTRNDLPNERHLKLQFMVEVPDTVQTGTELIGKGGECLKLALLDANEHIVTSGCESSARVEIVLLDASSNDDEIYITPENFEGRIIRAGDKEKPHFAKNFYIHLNKGVGTLSGLKLGHNKDWTKSCNCSLGAMIMQKFAGQEAWTAPFKVIDKRGKHYEKHTPPFPSSEVWRLKGIGRDGKPCSRLTENNIRTVLDFLFWFSVNPNGLQKEILRTGDCKWNVIVAHAQDCIIDDKTLYSHKSPTEPQTRVIYDTVGELKGVIEDEAHFVPIDNLFADKKDSAHKLLASVLERSAFERRYRTSFPDEASLLQQFPSRSSNSSIQQLSEENNHGYDQLYIPSPSIGPFDSLGSILDTDLVPLWNFGQEYLAYFSTLIDRTGGPETVAGSSNDAATAGGEVPLRDCFSNADEVKIKFQSTLLCDDVCDKAC